MDYDPAESDMDGAPESTSNSENWLNWIIYVDNPNRSEVDWDATNESKIELGDGIKTLESLEYHVVSVAPNVPGLIRPTRRSLKQAGKWFMTVSSMKPGGIRETRKSRTHWVNMGSRVSICCLTENLT